MKHILCDSLPWLAIALLVVGIFAMPRLDRPDYIKGDRLSEHIVDCETCSDPDRPADACPTGIRIQDEISGWNKLSRKAR